MSISKAKWVLSSVLAVFLASAILPSTALALPTEGPFWVVSGSALPQGESKAVTGKAVSSTSLYGKVGGKFLKLTCTAGTSSGSLFDATAYGEGLEKIAFSGCTKVEEASSSTGPYTLVKNCEIDAENGNDLTTNEIKTSLWYDSTNVGKTRTSLAQVLFTPKTGLVLATVTLEGTGCGVLEGVYKAEVNMAAEAGPENTEVGIGSLTFPSEQARHLWRPAGSGEETQVSLLFNATEARLEGGQEVELTSKEEFGPFQVRYNWLEPSPTVELNMGSYKVGEPTAKKGSVTFMFVGPGLGSGKLAEPRVKGKTDNSFKKEGEKNCKGVNLKGTETCEVKIEFKPENVGLLEGEVIVELEDHAKKIVFPLKGTGTM